MRAARAHRRAPRCCAALAAVLAASTGARQAAAFCRTTTVRPASVGDCAEGGQPLHWRSVCASWSLYAGGTGEAGVDQQALRQLVDAAAVRWHQAPCDENATTQPYFELHPLADAAVLSGYNRNSTNANTISFNNEWPSDRLHDPDAIAITIVTHDTVTGEIFDADMEVNARYYQFTLDGMSTEQIDLHSVMVHEFGHFQGLSHNQENAMTVMFPSLQAGERRRDISADDAAGICSIYPPEARPDRVCNLVPYGGLATTRTGGRVVGGCRATPGADARSTAPLGTAGVALALVGLRARRRRRR